MADNPCPLHIQSAVSSVLKMISASRWSLLVLLVSCEAWTNNQEDLQVDRDQEAVTVRYQFTNGTVTRSRTASLRVTVPLICARNDAYGSSEKEPPGGLTIDYKLLEKETRTLLCERQQDLTLTLNSTNFLEAFGKYMVEIADKLSNSTKIGRGIGYECSSEGILFPNGALNYKWVKERAGTLRDKAVTTGQYGIYVGRVWHGNDLLPAIILVFESTAVVVTSDGKMYKNEEYEVLSCDDIAWVPTNRTMPLPDNAFIVGRIKEDGRRLYMGRYVSSALTAGKVEPSDRRLKIGYARKEWKFSEYEILVKNSKYSSHRWISSVNANGIIPENAVVGGYDVPKGNKIYVGRSWHENNLLPCKIAPRHSTVDAHVTFAGTEVWVHNFEYLVASDVSWIPMNSTNNIPPMALEVGHTSSQEPLYVGRTKTVISPEPSAGTVDPIDGCLHLAYKEDQEIKICNNFEIMVNRCMKSADTF